MAGIYPGQEFEIEYGKNQRLTVRALSGLQQQQELGPLIDNVNSAGNLVELATAAKTLLDYIAGEQVSDDLWKESVDAEMVVGIARKLIDRTGISDDESKK